MKSANEIENDAGKMFLMLTGAGIVAGTICGLIGRTEARNNTDLRL